MTTQPTTKAELLDALTVERFGPLTPEYRNHRDPEGESTTDQVIRQHELALAVDDIAVVDSDTDPRPDAVLTASPEPGGAAQA